MKKLFGVFTLVSICIFIFVQAQSSTEYKGFVMTKSLKIAERDCTVQEFEHTATGAQVLHIQTDDPENFFSICFRTYPKGANGVPHILEHCLMQSGSEKYPVENTLMRIKNRSFATFINALTSYEQTCYPAASLNERDFYNLFDVYFQSVFHPRLSPSVFRQEGHRFEFTEHDNPDTALTYNGVVYNEMKGVLSLPERHLVRHIVQDLYPVTFGPSFAGGDPQVITDLSYEEFLQFYNEHYYPGNCLFFFYGNIPVEKHLDYLSEELSGKFAKKEALAHPPVEPAFTQPRTSSYCYPERPDGDHLVGISWLTSSSNEDFFALRLLDSILMATDASPLKHEIITSGLCKNVDSGFESNMRQLPYLFIVSGCTEDDANQIEGYLLNALCKIYDQGIPKEVIDRTFARLELAELEIQRGIGAPVGLSMLYSSGLAKLTGKQAEGPLMIQTHINNVRKKLEQDPRYLESLIKRYFIDNPHRVSVKLHPGAKVASDTEKLAAIKASLSQEEIDEIISIAKEIRKPPKGDVELLPTITLDDVSETVSRYDLKKEMQGDLTIFHYPVTTNHITYAQVEFPLPQLTSEELTLVGLYSYLLPQLGTKERSYLENIAYIEAHTGGITSSVVLRRKMPYLALSGKALDRKAEYLFDLFYDISHCASFSDREHVKVLLKKHMQEVENGLKNNAVEVAALASLACVSKSMDLKNSVEGLSYAHTVLGMDVDETIDKLILLQKKLMPHDANLLLISDEKPKSFGKLPAIPHQSIDLHEQCKEPICRADFYYPIASQVAFNARGFHTKEGNPYLSLAANLVSDKHLYPRIRVEGGAYGVRATYEPLYGNFTFITYRDPNINFSNEVFGEAISLLANGEFTDEDIKKAKIAVLQKLDLPKHPCAQAEAGYMQIMEGIEYEFLNQFRKDLLAATKEDIQMAARKYLVEPFTESTLVSFASKELVDREKITLEEYSASIVLSN